MSSHKQAAKMGSRIKLIFAKYIFASLAIWPALVINVDWTGGAGVGWTMAAIFGIVFASVMIEVSRHQPWHVGAVLMLAGLFGCYCNMLVAMKSANHASEDEIHLRRLANFAANTASSQSSQWVAARDAALLVVQGDGKPAEGWTPVESLEAARTTLINGPTSRWNHTDGCKVGVVQAGVSKTFCEAVGKLDARIAAAKTRDLQQAKIDAAAKTGTSTVKQVEDPFADGFPKFAAGFGVTVKPENATAHLNGTRAMWLELMAGLGFMALLAMWELAEAGITSVKARLEPRERVPASSPAEARQGPEAPPVSKPAVDPKIAARERREAAAAHAQLLHDAYVVDRLEGTNGVAICSKEAWKLWDTYCRQRGEDPGGDRRAFKARMEASGFTYDLGSNRPRFLNVRAKPKKADLRVVGG
jgi:hypothetical protein